MKKLILTLLVISAVSVLQAQQVSDAFAKRMQFVLDSVCEKYSLSGASVAVLVPGAGTWTGVHGVAAPGQPITTGMLFGIGSDTKTYTATLMLKLQEQGVLSISDTIGTWIRHPNINGQITIKQLLGHTSGIREFEEFDSYDDSMTQDFDRIWRPEEALNFIGAPYFAPGAGFHYSNSNYIIAGIIIRDAMHQPFSTTLNQLLLAPNGLKHTFLFPEQTPGDPIADPWSVRNSTGALIDLMDYGYSNNSNFSLGYTCGGIMTTAEENARFWHLLISGNLLNAGSMAQMMEWGADVIAGTNYGLGIMRYRNGINGHKPYYSHGGTDIGYIFENAVDSTNGISISILTNQDSISNSILRSRLLPALHKVTMQVSAVTGVDEQVYNSTSVNVYPNPANDYIRVQSSSYRGNITVRINSMDGRNSIVRNIVRDGDDHIRLDELAPGLYILSIEDESGILMHTQKLQVGR